MKKKKHTAYCAHCAFLASVFLLSGCIQHSSNVYRRYMALDNKTTSTLETNIDIPQGPPPINIWVHGTRFTPLTYLFKKNFYCPEGLSLAKDLSIDYHMRQRAESFMQYNSHLFNPDTFYLFGWCGKLCFKRRMQWAERLYDDLKLVIENYKQTYKQAPVIRIFTHSHGGNIVLNLARLKQPQDTDLVIDQLVMLAVPVQAQTRELVKDSMFKKIYALYSRLDMMQIMDPQGLYYQGVKAPFFSRRRFAHQKNIHQVKIKLDGRAAFHTEFSTPKFLAYLPDVIQAIDEWHEQELHEVSMTPKTRKQLCVYTREKKVPRRFARHKKRKSLNVGCC